MLPCIVPAQTGAVPPSTAPAAGRGGSDGGGGGGGGAGAELGIFGTKHIKNNFAKNITQHLLFSRLEIKSFTVWPGLTF